MWDSSMEIAGFMEQEQEKLKLLVKGIWSRLEGKLRMKKTDQKGSQEEKWCGGSGLEG